MDDMYPSKPGCLTKPRPVRELVERLLHPMSYARLPSLPQVMRLDFLSVRMDLDRLVDQIRKALEPMGTELVCAYLFGSTARGTSQPRSDLDLALLLAREPPTTLAGLRIDLADALTEALGRPVDLVLLNRASCDLIHRVLRDGVLLLDNDPSARIRFEVKSRNDYFDLLPYLREYRRPPERTGA